jgi:hypothetical protein
MPRVRRCDYERMQQLEDQSQIRALAAGKLLSRYALMAVLGIGEGLLLSLSWIRFRLVDGLRCDSRALGPENGVQRTGPGGATATRLRQTGRESTGPTIAAGSLRSW